MVLLGGAAPTALQGRGALQDIDQRPLIAPHVKLLQQGAPRADLAPAVEEAFAVAREGVPGPVFVECPVDLLYDEAIVRQWYADAAGKGTSLADRLLRCYLNRHVEQMFAGSERRASHVRAHEVVPPAPPARASTRGAALARAERPLIVIGSQALSLAGEAAAHRGRGRASSACRSTCPGMARGLLGPRAPAADAPRAPRGAARGRLRAARRRALRLPARLRPPRTALRDADRREPQRAGRRA